MEFAKNGGEYLALRETTKTEGAAADGNEGAAADGMTTKTEGAAANASTWRYAKRGPATGSGPAGGPKRGSRGPPVLAKTPAPGHTSVFSQKPTSRRSARASGRKLAACRGQTRTSGRRAPRSRAHARTPAAGYPQSLTGEGATRQGPALHETAQREVDSRRPGGELPGRLARGGARTYSPRVATFRPGILT